VCVPAVCTAARALADQHWTELCALKVWNAAQLFTVMRVGARGASAASAHAEEPTKLRLHVHLAYSALVDRLCNWASWMIAGACRLVAGLPFRAIPRTHAAFAERRPLLKR
jgi:hypothetical protein